MALQPGDIIFIGWDADADDVAFIATAALAEGEVIYFTDSEWNGTEFAAGENLIEWTVPTGGIPAGTTVTVDLTFGAGNTTEIVEGTVPGGDSIGDTEVLSGGGNISGGNEMFWAFQGSRDDDDEVTPENFISVIGNETTGGSNVSPNLSGTGLTQSNGAIIIDGDNDYMEFGGWDDIDYPISGDGLIEAISDTDQWETADTGPAGGNDNPNPGGGFVEPSPGDIYSNEDVTTLYFNGDTVGFVSSISSAGGGYAALDVAEQPFLATDVIEVDILNASIQANGEFDHNQVILTRVTVVRDGLSYDFDVPDGTLVALSGATNSSPGTSMSQGDTFFVTGGSIGPPVGATPFSDVTGGSMAFSIDEELVEGETTEIRTYRILDNNSDGWLEPGDGNFNIGLVAAPLVPCFTLGTLIETDQGECPVEDLKPGDLVRTADNGFQPVRWIGRKTVRSVGNFIPIRITAGTMNNARDVIVSPQHRILLEGWQAELLFGEPQVLVAAKHLCDGTRIFRDRSFTDVDYFHVLFDDHQVVFTSGLQSESFFPGSTISKNGEDEMRDELVDLFPEKFEGHGAPDWETARMCLRAYEAPVFTAGRRAA